MNNVAVELNNEDNELINAAIIPATTSPLSPSGKSVATIVGNTWSPMISPLIFLFISRMPFALSAAPIRPGIRKIITGQILKNAPNNAPLLAVFKSFAAKVLWTMY